MQDHCIRDGQGFMLVYSITSRATFDYLTRLREQIFRIKDEDEVPFILVGGECDLENVREIERHQGQDLAHQWGCPFMEVSAKANINISEAFFELACLVHAKYGKMSFTSRYSNYVLVNIDSTHSFAAIMHIFLWVLFV